MCSDKRRIYLFAVLLTIFLLLSFFIPFSYRRILVGIFLSVFAIAIYFFIRKRSILSIYKKQVMLIMFFLGLTYIVLYYLSGLKYGFYKNLYALDNYRFVKYIIPITAIIISIELIRRVILAQKNKFANVLIFISSIMVDLVIFINYSKILSFNSFMEIFAMALFPAITSNILYTYISKKYGMWPNVLYRIIITIYLYFVTTVPKTADIMIAFIKVILPLAICLFIKVLYEKQSRFINYKKKSIVFCFSILGILGMVSIVMLISCQFRYGMLVIGSESMTGAINKGDAVVYEKYVDQNVEVGDVIIFEKGERTIVHRVVDIAKINNEIRYITKGDANEEKDTGYVIESQIKGITKFRIIYIGYPTIWIRSLFDN